MRYIRNYDCTGKYITESTDKLKLSDYTLVTKSKGDTSRVYNWYDGDTVVVTVLVDRTAASDGYKWFGSFRVNKKYRRRGLGDQAIKYIIKNFDASALAVEKTNKPAINLYKKNGFKISKERLDDKYYYMYRD